jgi:hypothetical protein
VQCDPNDALPDHFVRLSILHWLERSQRLQGPAGVLGFHQVGRIVQDLTQLGHDANRVREELLFLAREGCVVAEHLRLDGLGENDLVKLTASGLVHLQLMANPDYLAACAEDTWVSEPEFAQRIATRIASRGRAGHFSRLTTSKNATEFVDYLRARAGERLSFPDAYLEKSKLLELNTLREAESAVGATEIEVSRRLYVGNIPYSSTVADVKDALAVAGIEVVDVNIPLASSGKNRGFAFVEVKDAKAAMEALDSPDLAVGGRRIVVNEAQQPKAESSRLGRVTPSVAEVSERLYVGNLPYTATEESVRNLFVGHGFRPLEIYVAFDRELQRAKGYAFVSMASEEEALPSLPI